MFALNWLDFPLYISCNISQTPANSFSKYIHHKHTITKNRFPAITRHLQSNS
uniref:Uncharacterized protein n=1 Tax=Arundo donax TaxID=35708 RepID=A0A0A8XV34_ARUDO